MPRPAFVFKLWSSVIPLHVYLFIYLLFSLVPVWSHICENNHQILTVKRGRVKKGKKKMNRLKTGISEKSCIFLKNVLIFAPITFFLSHPRALCWVWQKKCIIQLDCFCERNNPCNRVLGVSLITFWTDEITGDAGMHLEELLYELWIDTSRSKSRVSTNLANMSAVCSNVRNTGSTA